VRPVDFDGYRAEWVYADDVATTADEAQGAVLYFHGGAFVSCGVATHRHAVALISRSCQLPVLSVAYRQLPTVRLGGSVDDCLTAYQWLLDQGFDPSKVVFAGDSAGGHLAFATALAAAEQGLPQPAGIVAASPWLDFDSTGKLAHPNANRDAYAPVSKLSKLTRLLLGDLADAAQRSPVNQDLTGLPPVLLIAAEGEMLRLDAEVMADRLAEADVPVTLQIWKGQVHAFPVLGDLLPESRAALKEIGAFVRRVIDPAHAATAGLAAAV
jgi:acetyl esterase/lipase